jgi:hypothetical protein
VEADRKQKEKDEREKAAKKKSTDMIILGKGVFEKLSITGKMTTAELTALLAFWGVKAEPGDKKKADLLSKVDNYLLNNPVVAQQSE